MKPWQARNPATAGGSAKEVHQNAWNGQPSLAMQVWIPGEARKQQEMATNKGHGEQELWPGWLWTWLLRRNTEAGPAATREPRHRGYEDPNPRGPYGRRGPSNRSSMNTSIVVHISSTPHLRSILDDTCARIPSSFIGSVCTIASTSLFQEQIF